MLPIGKLMNQRYSVFDSKGNLATSYNLGLGKALALRLAKLSCDQIQGKVSLDTDGEAKGNNVIYQKTKRK